jgi:hypothetical protein
MSAYIKLSTLEYPRYEGDIRSEHPDITEDQTWPNFPCPDTYAVVTQTSMPVVGAGQVCFETEPVQIDGVWTQTWGVRDLTQEEIDFFSQRQPLDVTPMPNN